jgi:3-phosphoshikimate 1-carboxyvinyltransferase
MDIRITPAALTGTVTPPPSKSMAHRLLITAALTDRGVSVIHGLADSQDMLATRRCLSALGARIDDVAPGTVEVRGLGSAIVEAGPAPILDCGESGSTLRFLIPLALLVNGQAEFVGHGRLMERPLKPYETLFREKGIVWKLENGVLDLDGGKGYDDYALSAGAYRLPGNVSSQFFTGLLFVLPLLDGDSTLVPTTPLESIGYLNMTREAQQRAGVVSQWQGDTLWIPGNQRYQPFEAETEADWSQAAFWYAAAFLDHSVTLSGLNPASSQGDRVISELYWKLARPGDAEIDLSDCPDLLPPLAVMAAVRSGTTRFVNAARLRIKESDRLATTAALLRALGGQVAERPDGLDVQGGTRFSGGVVDGANDHRIVMAAAIAATRASGPVTISGAEAVNKSYPSFWEDYQRLGGVTHVL